MNNNIKIIYILFTIVNLATGSLCFSQNNVSTYSGDGIAGLLNGSGNSSRFNEPFGICRDDYGNLFVADGSNHCIRKIDKNGYSSVYAGTTIAGFADGNLLTARFNNPVNLCIDDTGNIYISDFQNHRIRKISKSGIVSTIAGSGIAGYLDGTPSVAQFNYPRGIAVDSIGNIYIADSWNHRIRKIDWNTHEVSTFAGGGNNIGVGSTGDLVDAQGTDARFYTPSGLAIDNSGNLYVADPFNHRIRKIDHNQHVTTIAGSGLTGPNNGGFANGAGSTARFDTPTDLYWMFNGNILIADTYNNRVRVIDTSIYVSNLAGNGNAGFVDGPDSIAEFNFPRGIAGSSQGDSVFIVDYNNHSIRLITKSGMTAINNNPDKNLQRISLFPNPANDITRLEMEPSGKMKVAIYNPAGCIVYRKEINKPITEIEIGNQTPGVYIVVIRKDNFTNSIKLVVQH